MIPFNPNGRQSESPLLTGVMILMITALWQLFDAAGITGGEDLPAADNTAHAMWARAGPHG